MGTGEEHGPENVHPVGHGNNFGVYSNCIEKPAETFEHWNYTTDLPIRRSLWLLSGEQVLGMQEWKQGEQKAMIVLHRMGV